MWQIYELNIKVTNKFAENVYGPFRKSSHRFRTNSRMVIYRFA